MSMSFKYKPLIFSLYSLTMSGYATLKWSFFLESHHLLVLLAFSVENDEPRITPLSSYHFTTRNDTTNTQFKSIC